MSPPDPPILARGGARASGSPAASSPTLLAPACGSAVPHAIWLWRTSPKKLPRTHASPLCGLHRVGTLVGQCMPPRRRGRSGALEDVHAPAAVDQVHEGARVQGDVVAADALLAVGDGRQERRDLAR